MHKRDLSLRQELDRATRLRLEKTARLRELRLAKEAQDAAEEKTVKDLKTSRKSAVKRGRSSY
jgi:hypothetical protein